MEQFILAHRHINEKWISKTKTITQNKKLMALGHNRYYIHTSRCISVTLLCLWRPSYRSDFTPREETASTRHPGGPLHTTRTICLYKTHHNAMWRLRASCDIMLVSQLNGGQHIEQESYVIRNHIFLWFEGSGAMRPCSIGTSTSITFVWHGSQSRGLVIKMKRRRGVRFVAFGVKFD